MATLAVPSPTHSTSPNVIVPSGNSPIVVLISFSATPFFVSTFTFIV